MYVSELKGGSFTLFLNSQANVQLYFILVKFNDMIEEIFITNFNNPTFNKVQCPYLSFKGNSFGVHFRFVHASSTVRTWFSQL